MMDSKVMQMIQQKFLKKLQGLLPVFSSFSNKVKQEKPSHEELIYIRIFIHQIAGSAKTFCFPDTSKYADKVEHYIDMLLGETDKQEQDDKIIAQNLHDSFQVLIAHTKNLIQDKLEVSAEPSKSDTTEHSSEEKAKYKVLIGDDDTLVTDFIRQYLEDKGCQVLEVADSEMVLPQINKHQPDLILLDVIMPGISGFEILRELKHQQKTRDIPVIMLTKRIEDESIIEGISSGAVDYITKPFDIEDLVTRVLATLEKSSTTIMVVDDDEIICELLSHRFHKKGYNVITATNGKDALIKFHEKSPDLILLDIIMPGIDGMALLNQIKVQMQSDVPVVMLTAKNQVDTTIKCLEEGAHDYITKPFDIDELIARVTAILTRREKMKKST